MHQFLHSQILLSDQPSPSVSANVPLTFSTVPSSLHHTIKYISKYPESRA
jgi:hypothetical protein